MFIVMHPAAGLVTTEAYEERAHERAKMLIEQYGEQAYVIETPRITRMSAAQAPKRIYKLEKERLQISQEFIT